MQPIHLFFEDAPETIPVPSELHHKRILVVFRPWIQGASMETDDKKPPADLSEENAFPLTDLPNAEDTKL